MDDTGVLCQKGVESIDHLFFEWEFNTQVRNELRTDPVILVCTGCRFTAMVTQRDYYKRNKDQ